MTARDRISNHLRWFLMLNIVWLILVLSNSSYSHESL